MENQEHSESPRQEHSSPTSPHPIFEVQAERRMSWLLLFLCLLVGGLQAALDVRQRWDIQMGGVLDDQAPLPLNVALLEQSLRNDPENWRLHWRLGQLLLLERQPGKAVSHFQEALRFGGQSPEIHAGLSRAYRMFGRTDKAREWLRKCRRLHPGTPFCRATNLPGP